MKYGRTITLLLLVGCGEPQDMAHLQPAEQAVAVTDADALWSYPTELPPEDNAGISSTISYSLEPDGCRREVRENGVLVDESFHPNSIHGSTE